MNLERVLPILLVATLGMFLPAQAGINGRLGRALGHPLWAAAVSFSVGWLGVVTAALVSRAAWPAWADTWATGVPRWAWFGGLLGAAWVTGSLWAAPRIGASTFIMTAFVGQLVGSLLLDGTGSFGFARVEINAARIGGVALVIAGLAVAELGRPR